MADIVKPKVLAEDDQQVGSEGGRGRGEERKGIEGVVGK